MPFNLFNVALYKRDQTINETKLIDLAIQYISRSDRAQ